jgi:hypothetical protein
VIYGALLDLRADEIFAQRPDRYTGGGDVCKGARPTVGAARSTQVRCACSRCWLPLASCMRAQLLPPALLGHGEHVRYIRHRRDDEGGKSNTSWRRRRSTCTYAGLQFPGRAVMRLRVGGVGFEREGSRLLAWLCFASPLPAAAECPAPACLPACLRAKQLPSQRFCCVSRRSALPRIGSTEHLKMKSFEPVGPENRGAVGGPPGR